MAKAHWRKRGKGRSAPWKKRSGGGVLESRLKGGWKQREGQTLGDSTGAG